jgi:hypothetical protein
MRTKVFVTQEQSKLNYLPAEKYGEIEFITRDEFSPVARSLGNVTIVQTIKDKLANFDPEKDYIVVSGSPVVAAAVFAHIGSMHQRFTVIRWSNRDNIYTPTTVDLTLRG